MCCPFWAGGTELFHLKDTLPGQWLTFNLVLGLASPVDENRWEIVTVTLIVHRKRLGSIVHMLSQLSQEHWTTLTNRSRSLTFATHVLTHTLKSRCSCCIRWTRIRSSDLPESSEVLRMSISLFWLVVVDSCLGAWIRKRTIHGKAAGRQQI